MSNFLKKNKFSSGLIICMKLLAQNREVYLIYTFK